MKYKLYWNALILGFFSNSTISGVDIIDADSIEDAWEVAFEDVSQKNNDWGGVFFSVNDVLPI